MLWQSLRYITFNHNHINAMSDISSKVGWPLVTTETENVCVVLTYRVKYIVP